MSVVLVDTNIVSFLLKGDSRADDYSLQLNGHHLAVSFMTAAELFQWAAMHHWGAKRIAEMRESLDTYIVLPADIEVCRIWGEVRAYRRSTGTPISPRDAWIAACALHHNLTLVTHNPADFRDLEQLRIFSLLQ